MSSQKHESAIRFEAKREAALDLRDKVDQHAAALELERFGEQPLYLRYFQYKYDKPLLELAQAVGAKLDQEPDQQLRKLRFLTDLVTERASYAITKTAINSANFENLGLGAEHSVAQPLDRRQEVARITLGIKGNENEQLQRIASDTGQTQYLWELNLVPIAVAFSRLAGDNFDFQNTANLISLVDAAIRETDYPILKLHSINGVQGEYPEISLARFSRDSTFRQGSEEGWRYATIVTREANPNATLADFKKDALQLAEKLHQHYLSQIISTRESDDFLISRPSTRSLFDRGKKEKALELPEFKLAFARVIYENFRDLEERKHKNFETLYPALLSAQELSLSQDQHRVKESKAALASATNTALIAFLQKGYNSFLNRVEYRNYVLSALQDCKDQLAAEY